MYAISVSLLYEVHKNILSLFELLLLNKLVLLLNVYKTNYLLNRVIFIIKSGKIK